METITLTTNPIKSLLSNIISPTQAKEVFDLKYQDNSPIYDTNRQDIIFEIIGMFKSLQYDEVIKFLKTVRKPRDILWEQPSMEEGRTKVLRELVIYQEDLQGVKGVGKCKFCPSTELSMGMKQLRSGDEPMTVIYQCVKCHKKWSQ